MAGAGYKLFGAGDILTAGQVNTFLNEQSVMVFATTAARDAALTGVLAEGMTCYVKDITGNGTAGTCVYDGAVWKITWSEWETFATAWDNVTVGNGTSLSGRFCYAPGGMLVHIRFIHNTTTSVTGPVSFDVPNGETTASSGPYSVGNGYFTSGGSPSDSLIVPLCGNSETSVPLYSSSLSQFNTASPVTWATGNSWVFTVHLALD